MAITLTESQDSRPTTTGRNAAVELRYILEGTADDGAAKAHLLANTAAVYSGLIRQSTELEPICVDTVAGTGRWRASVRYGVQEESAEQPVTQFDTSGGTQHVTQSLGTVGVYAPPGATAPDFQGAIGVTQDSVDGVDITVPVYTWSETHYLSNSAVAPLTYYALTGKVSTAAFRGFAAGEVLFLGATGSRRGNDNWEVTFRFAASPNVADLTIGDITGIAKGGWQYLWVRYADVEDSNAGMIVKRPVAVYIEQVYPTGNMALLGIGTT